MNITTLTPQQLRKAADLKENIDGLQEQLNAILGGGETPTPAAPEEPGRPKNGRRRKKRKKVSAEGRANIAAAQRARWAARRGEAVPEEAPATEPEQPVKRQRNISAAGRRAMSLAAKARWAKAKQAGRSRL